MTTKFIGVVDLVNVGNAPASPGQALAVAAADVGTSVEVSIADLTPGVSYKLQVTPDSLANTVRGLWKCDTAVGGIVDATDGEPILQYSPVQICLPSGSTKVRVFFWLLADTPHDCTVWLSRADA